MVFLIFAFLFYLLVQENQNSKNILVCFYEFLFFLFELYQGEDHDENVEWLSYE